VRKRGSHSLMVAPDEKSTGSWQEVCCYEQMHSVIKKTI